MTTFQTELSSKEYTITLEVEDFLKIMQLDNFLCVTEDVMCYNLAEQLSELEGVYKVEYHGRFGPHIYVGLILMNDTRELWVKIYEIISDYIKAAKDEESYK